MKHSTHIARAALGQTVAVWLTANQGKRKRAPWKKTAAAIGKSPRVCKRAHRYFEAHKDEPRIEALGELRHEDVVRWGFTGIETLRETLIRNFSATIGLAKAPLKMSNGEVKKLGAICGLDSATKAACSSTGVIHPPPEN